MSSFALLRRRSCRLKLPHRLVTQIAAVPGPPVRCHPAGRPNCTNGPLRPKGSVRQQLSLDLSSRPDNPILIS